MTPTSDSPQARLVASRNALVRHMARADGRSSHDAPNDLHGSEHAQTDDAQTLSEHSSTWQIFTQAAVAWWQHHPAQVAIDIGRPLLSSYARDKPLQLLGIAAAVGATAVLIKPWRMVSVTGLAVAALKSTKLSTALLSLLPRASSRQHARQTQHRPKDVA